MLKLIITGVWVCIVTLGSVYLSIQMSKAPEKPDPEAARKAVQELVRGEVTTFPVISEGKVQGYFLTRTSYIVDKTKLAEITLPIPELITDELYTALVGNRVIKIGSSRNFDLDAFRKTIKETLNARLEADVIQDIIVEQIDYLSKDDIRSNIAQKQMTIKSGEKIIDAPMGEPATDENPPAH